MRAMPLVHEVPRLYGPHSRAARPKSCLSPNGGRGGRKSFGYLLWRYLGSPHVAAVGGASEPQGKRWRNNGSPTSRDYLLANEPFS